MDPSFWHERWEEGRIGFHQSEVTPLLLAHWSLPRDGGCVFVPLAGKSLDMLWFASQGYSVLGVELSVLAIEQFFEEASLSPVRDGNEWSAGGITLIEGDVFELTAERLASCAYVYDRAALIALPPSMRERYLSSVYGALPAACRGLLITLEYPQLEKSGPPFSVSESEVRSGLSGWSVELLERRDILAAQPKFIEEGVTALSTAAYSLARLQL